MRQIVPRLLLVLCACLPGVAAALGNIPALQRLDQARLVVHAGTAEAAVKTVRLPAFLSPVSPGQSASLVFTFEAAGAGSTLALHVEATREHFTAYLNGVAVFDSRYGDPDAPPLRSWRMSPTFELPNQHLRTGRNELELALHAPAGRALRLAPVWVGTPAAVHARAFRHLLRDELGPLGIAGVLATLAVFALAVARESRDRELLLLYATTALIYVVTVLAVLVPVQPLPTLHLSSWWYSLYMWGAVTQALLALRFASLRWPAFERLLWVLAAAALPLLYSAAWLEAPLGIYGLWLTLCLAVGVPVMGKLALRWRKGRDARAGWVLLLLTMIWAASVHDLVVGIVQQSIIKHFVLVPWAGLVNALWVGWILLARFRGDARELAVLNRQLDARVRLASSRLEEKLVEVETAQRRAEDASAAKSTFLAAVSHDLRQPLHSLGLFVSALERHIDNAEGRQMQRRVQGAFAALEGLFDELLDLSRLEAGTVQAQVADTPLQPLFDRLGDIFHAEAERRGLGLRFVPTRAVVQSDPVLLERIVANLVTNALRYTREGHVLVGVHRRSGGAVIEVRDSGIGIAPEHQQRIFDDFYQVQNPARDRRQGIGLGLAIVRRLAALLGHHIELRSQPDRGTVVAVHLPLAPVGAVAAAPAVPPLAPPGLEGRRVLVVDDDVEVREATLALLRLWGVQAQAAAGPDGAQALLQDGFEAEALIVDLRLGAGIDGIQLVQQVRRRGTPLPALLVSGEIGARKDPRVQQCGLPLLLKPVAPARLKAALHAVLRPETLRGGTTP